jgi:hypothetical protein
MHLIIKCMELDFIKFNNFNIYMIFVPENIIKQDEFLPISEIMYIKVKN